MVPAPQLARPLALVALFTATAGLLKAGPNAYAVDPAASRVRIHLGRAGLMKFLGHDHEIEAPVAAGSVDVMDEDPAHSSVTLRFASARLAIVPGSEPADDVAKVERRMRGEEVLAVARYPEIVFASTAVRGQADDGPSLRIVVSGTLTLRGRSYPVEIPLAVAREGPRMTARGGLDLDLRDLGIEPPSVAGVVKVANRFRLEFEIRATASDRSWGSKWSSTWPSRVETSRGSPPPAGGLTFPGRVAAAPMTIAPELLAQPLPSTTSTSSPRSSRIGPRGTRVEWRRPPGRSSVGRCPP